jgi:hypothetical protein
MYCILINMEDKFVNIKIRKEFRDMLKEYSKNHGYKMYALIEELIKEKCTKRILYSNQT